MNTWQILGIDPTIEVSAIKKAYAKKLKIYHPEDDPQGFQMLREAYDIALKFAKNNQLHNAENIVSIEDRKDTLGENKTQELFIDENYYSPPNANIIDDFVDAGVNREQLAEEFFEKAGTLYNNFFNRIEEKNWQELLNDEVMWRLDCKELINSKMIRFLMLRHYLPKNIWLLLNGIFHWNEQESYLNSCYPTAFIKYLFMQISQDRVPRYCYFDKNIEIDYDEYLNYRDEVFTALLDNDLKRAEHYISLAYDMYSKDPDLLCMRGDYYLRIKKKFKASAAFKEAIRINPKDKYIFFYQVEAMINNKKYLKALKICNSLKASSSKDLELRRLLGKCYISTKNWRAASKLFKGSLKVNPSDIETRKYLKELANQFRVILKKHPFKLILRQELKEIYCILGEQKKVEKITSKELLNLFKRLMKICLVIFSILIVIVLADKGFGGSIVIIVFIIRFVLRANKKIF